MSANKILVARAIGLTAVMSVISGFLAAASFDASSTQIRLPNESTVRMQLSSSPNALRTDSPLITRQQAMILMTSVAGLAIGFSLRQRLEEHDKEKLLKALMSGDYKQWNRLKASQKNPIRLPTIDLTGRNLSRFDLSQVMFSEAKMTHCNLQFANFEGADLRRVDFRFTNLMGANLTFADLRGAVMDYCNLENATISGSELFDVTLCHANLSHAILDESRLIHTQFTYANLSGATAISSTWTHSDLTGANLEDCNLCWANLTGCTLEGSNLLGVDCRESQPQGAIKSLKTKTPAL